MATGVLAPSRGKARRTRAGAAETRPPATAAAAADGQRTSRAAQRTELARQTIRIAIDRGWTAGRHLPEHELAGLLQVSRSPVRAVLDLLATLGVVERRANAGYFLLLGEEALRGVRVDPAPSAEERLYRRIVRDRADGALPQTVTQTLLARRYDVSRTFLLGVLRKMAQEGMVLRNRGHGWRFSATLDSVQSQRSSYEFRAALEPAAMRMPEFRPDLLRIKELEAEHTRLLNLLDATAIDGNWLFELDARFHGTIAEFSGNPFIVAAIEQQNHLRRLLELSTYDDIDRVRAWCEEHLYILIALRTGEIRDAARLMERHLRTAGKILHNRPRREG
ncbi:MAG: FCD domain-containing protein [Alphaproteobacteria bacterium]